MDIVKHSPTHPKTKKNIKNTYPTFSLFENPSKYIDVKYIIQDVLIWIFPWSSGNCYLKKEAFDEQPTHYPQACVFHLRCSKIDEEDFTKT